MFKRLLLLYVLLLSPGVLADAWVIDVDGAIGPSTADHMVRGLERAQLADAQVVVLRIDTPGGLDTAMRDMIRAILDSSVPVVAYVAPSGARAASAGTYLLYASHLAAMAPGTNLGAATPVKVSAPGFSFLNKNSEQSETPMQHKIVNDAVAYIQSLAQLRGRNAQWAEVAVREGASLSAEDALQMGVIEFIAPSITDLLAQIDGLEVEVGEAMQVLHTQDIGIHIHPIDWRSEFLGVITNPNIAYILMLIGIYGLLIEFYQPGIGLAGVTGAICLLLAMYAFQALPVSYAGLALIILGLVLMTTEAFTPSFGLFGLGGLAAFVFGSILLMDTNIPAYQIALPVILGFAVFSVGLLCIALRMLMRAADRPLVTGLDHMPGMTAVVESMQSGVARVRLDGELWTVDCEDSLALHDTVTVDSIDGLTLHVSKNK